METILNLIGKEARRVTFSIQSDNNYYMLFSVIELLQPDMQDFLHRHLTAKVQEVEGLYVKIGI